MALQQIRIGSAEDVYQYDDAGFTSGINCTAPISAAPPVNPRDVVTLSDLPTLTNIVSSAAVIADHAVVRGHGGARIVQDSTVIVSDAGLITAPGGAVLGGVVNRSLVGATGDLTFAGSAGLPFGSCSCYEIGWAQAAVQNTWYNVSDVAFIDGQLNNVAHDGSGKLTVVSAGKYLCNVSFDWLCNVVNKHIEVGFEINGSGSAATEGIICNETKFADEEHSGSTTAILSLAAGETLELCVRTTDVGAPTITVDCVNLNCVQIGG